MSETLAKAENKMAETRGDKVICSVAALVPNSGVAALVGGIPIALFYIPSEKPSVFALENRDPFSTASVLSRGIVGDKNGELVVASPIYKQHFSLATGKCLEDPSVQIAVFNVAICGDDVVLTGI